jgi:O-methyltransferase
MQGPVGRTLSNYGDFPMLKDVTSKIAKKAYHGMMLRGYFRRLWYPRYQFQYFPRQLCFLADCIDKTASIDGAIVEIGCAHGLTTTFLYEYMVDSNISKEYYCIDTFSGFTTESIAFETKQRGKNHTYDGEFKNNSSTWFKESLSRRHINDIKIIEGDICTIDTNLLPDRIAFCLLDVDLYQPVKIGLGRVFERLSPGGMIVIDDCWSKPKHLWVDGIGDAYDGAMQAYKEFVSQNNLPEVFVETKLAVINRSVP